MTESNADKTPMTEDEVAEQIADVIADLTLLELFQILRKVQERSAVAFVKTPVAEPQAYDVVLESVETKQDIDVIKLIRSMGAIGLKEAKDLVDSAPVTVATNVPAEVVDDMRADFERAGAVITLASVAQPG